MHRQDILKALDFFEELLGFEGLEAAEELFGFGFEGFEFHVPQQLAVLDQVGDGFLELVEGGAVALYVVLGGLVFVGFVFFYEFFVRCFLFFHLNRNGIWPRMFLRVVVECSPF